ncbi:amidophosphoribosyltransferase [Balneicella halophila]|uniref:Amidophosphoribosyltransferase n=1 Tax=Balneicella halophila TaxID=1537566 RepID=A0A7L4USC2_BALHA|nr:amidophosphoribosyltransferase [Balneicella halophila]PVX52382.1 amidophosphoribosyltransferase [Balneicella halophila]
MSDELKHECGIALVRLLKPLEYYKEKYGTAFYGINKMYLLMEKQHNRGQDGAGLASIKFDMPPGSRYISRVRSNDATPIQHIFTQINDRINQGLSEHPDLANDVAWQKENLPYIGELILGHVRYGTYGKNSIESVHPFLRQNNWITRNLILAGNFNMTNVSELFEQLVDLGQHPKEKADTVTILEKIGHFLDTEVEELYEEAKSKNIFKKEATPYIAEHINVERILKKASKHWDGGYAIAGLMGHGDCFVLRDPAGIRPAYYYHDDEVMVVASERPVIQTAFDVPYETVHEIPPGNALITKKNGEIQLREILKLLERKSCSFERIYFSRGSDAEIYKERKMLGRLLVEQVMDKVSYDTVNTVFSYIPNTAETAFSGLVAAAIDVLNVQKNDTILREKEGLTDERLSEILSQRLRVEKIAVKDVKLRTFITEDSSRDDLVAHVYDVTYGIVNKTDSLVVVDDSIVRGTTLKKSILKMLDRLSPKKIVVVSSAPQIRYPDCYGIDMARLEDFVAFQAMLALLKDSNQYHKVSEVYEKCKKQELLPDAEVRNFVKELYDLFSEEEVSDKIGELLSNGEIKSKVEVVYQTVANLHKACPKNLGDWYFTGDYPTPGGNRVVNKAFINFVEGRKDRAY